MKVITYNHITIIYDISRNKARYKNNLNPNLQLGMFVNAKDRSKALHRVWNRHLLRFHSVHREHIFWLSKYVSHGFLHWTRKKRAEFRSPTPYVCTYTNKNCTLPVVFSLFWSSCSEWWPVETPKRDLQGLGKTRAWELRRRRFSALQVGVWSEVEGTVPEG